MNHNPTHQPAGPFDGINREIAAALTVSVLVTTGSIILLANVNDIPAVTHALLWWLLVVSVPTGAVAAGILTTRTHKQLRHRRTATTAQGSLPDILGGHDV